MKLPTKEDLDNHRRIKEAAFHCIGFNRNYECNHPETTKKLTAWATDCRGQHEQGFLMKDCCVVCGCLVE